MTDPNTPPVGQPPVAEGITIGAIENGISQYGNACKEGRHDDADAIWHDLIGDILRLAQSRPAPADAGMVDRDVKQMSDANLFSGIMTCHTTYARSVATESMRRMGEYLDELERRYGAALAQTETP